MACLCEHKEFMEIEWEVPTIESKECAEIVGLALEEIAEVRGVKVNLLSKTVTALCVNIDVASIEETSHGIFKSSQGRYFKESFAS